MQEAKEKREKLRRFKEEVLLPDEDYYFSEGAQKEVLRKAGAEKLRDSFGLGSRLVSTTRDIRLDGTPFVMIATNVEVFERASGQALAQCEGSANSREQMFTNTGTEKAADQVNAIGKMSQVRGFIGAVILGLGASDMFTQDISENAPPRGNPTPPAIAAPVRPIQDVRPVVRAHSDARPASSPRNPFLEQTGGLSPGEYVIEFGKYDGIAIRDMPELELKEYVDFLERDSRDKGRRLGGAAGKLVYLAKKFFGGAAA